MRTSVRIVNGLTPTEKGAIAEAEITAAAAAVGIVVARPLVEGRRYDLIFDTGPDLLRVQCKWGRAANDVIPVRTATSRHTPHRPGRREIAHLSPACSGPEQPEDGRYNGRRLPAWGCSSAGRASGWQPEGQGFEPPQLHWSEGRLRRRPSASQPRRAGSSSVSWCATPASSSFWRWIAAFSSAPKSSATFVSQSQATRTIAPAKAPYRAPTSATCEMYVENRNDAISQSVTATTAPGRANRNERCVTSGVT